MTYDFKTAVNRKTQGSFKWQGMYQQVPEMPEDVIPLSVADTDFRHMPELIEGLQAHLETMVLGYTGPTEAYYEAVLDWFDRRHHWQVEKDWLVQTPGVVAALYHAVKAYTKPGDKVVILSPVYYPFRSAIESSDRVVVASSLLETDNRYTIDFVDLEAKLQKPNTPLLIFCSPHNPVGRVWTKAELAEVDRLCRKHNVILVSDEIHFDLLLPTHTHTVMSTLSDEARENTIVLTAPSKTFNIAGMQTANAVIANGALREIYQAQLAKEGAIMINCLGPKSCELVYRHGEAWLEEFLELLDINRRLFEGFISTALPQLKVTPLEGTYLQWFNCQGLGMSDEELNRFLVEDCHLILDPGNLFGYEGLQYQRISLACPTADLEAALSRLAAGVKALT